MGIPSCTINAQLLYEEPALLGLALAPSREILRRKRHPFYTYKPDDHPERNQLAFHKSDATVRLVYGGNQSGKSRSVAQEAAWWLTESHPYQVTPTCPRIYCVSAGYRTIQEGIWKHLKVVIPEWMIARVGPGVPGPFEIPMFVRMKSGAQIDFISGEGGEDARRKLQAAEIDLLIVDEEVDLDIWEEGQARRMSRGGRAIIGATLVRSEDWAVALEERGMSGDPDVHLVRLSSYRARDAGHISAKTIAEMEASLPEEEKQVRLHGKSRQLEGKVYPEFGKDHICEPFLIPREWTRYCAIDPGFHTFAILWAAVAPDGKYYVYREVYKHAAHYLEMANAWYALSGYKQHPQNRNVWLHNGDGTENFEVIWVDPSAFYHSASGDPGVGTLLSELGIPVAPARNGLEAGIELTRASMLLGLDGKPRFHVFKTCPSLIGELRSYKRPKDVRDPNRPERGHKPIKRRDHACDCLRYLELGGLEYRPLPDPLLARMKKVERQYSIAAAPYMDEAMEREYMRILRKQTRGSTPPPHLGGIGCEY